MKLRGWRKIRLRRMRLAIVILAAGAAMAPAEVLADNARTCTAGTTLRLSAPEASQGSLLLIALKSTKPLAGVQGEWGGRTVPMWRAGTDGAKRRGLLGGDLEKATGEYELKITGESASGGEIRCRGKGGVRQGRLATER